MFVPLKSKSTNEWSSEYKYEQGFDGIYEGMPGEKQYWWMIRNEKFIHMVQEQDPMEGIAFKDKRPEKARRSADTFQSLSAAAAGIKQETMSGWNIG